MYVSFWPLPHQRVLQQQGADEAETLDVHQKPTFRGVAKDLTWGKQIKALTHLNGSERASVECE